MSFSVIRRPRQTAETAPKPQWAPKKPVRDARPILHLKQLAAD